MIYRTDAGGQEIRLRYRRVLDGWPVAAQRVRVPTREGETFVLACGPPDAPPLMLLHGSGTNAAMWRDEMTSWAQRFRVFAVDVIGEPGFSAPSRPPLGSEAYARWLDDVLDRLGLAQVSITGASLGGWLALDYATRRPARVSRLALLCPGGLGRQKWGWVVPALLFKPLGRWGARRSMRMIAGVDHRRAPEIADYLSLISAHFRYRRDRLPVFGDDALRALTMPVLVIVGGRDAMFDSAGTLRRVHQAIPHAETLLLPGVTHYIAGQTEAVLTFLSR